MEPQWAAYRSLIRIRTHRSQWQTKARGLALTRAYTQDLTSRMHPRGRTCVFRTWIHLSKICGKAKLITRGTWIRLSRRLSLQAMLAFTLVRLFRTLTFRPLAQTHALRRPREVAIRVPWTGRAWMLDLKRSQALVIKATWGECRKFKIIKRRTQT